MIRNVAVVTFALFAASCVTVAPPQPSSERCKAAMTALTHVDGETNRHYKTPTIYIGNGTFTSRSSADALTTPPSPSYGIFGWRQATPSRETAEAYVGAEFRSAFDCPGIRRLIRRQRDQILSDATVTRIVWSRHANKFYRPIITLELPVLNAQGTEALARQSSNWGPDAGSESFLLMRRLPDGEWMVVDEGITAIS